ncbi:MAG: ribosome maturation factor RimM [Gammaproteobacteria bacterium]|nr:ribosome maturation factor RimM [Gammaproteobacteria bacterium]
MTEPTAKSQWVELGRVSGLYGVKGWIKVFSHTEPMQNILNYLPWYLWLEGDWQPIELESGRVHGKGIVAHLANCPDRDAAQKLVGAKIAIKRDSMPKLAKDEFYWSDLIGLQVIDKTDVSIGRVDHLLETGANDVLVVKTADKKEILIPYIPGDVVQAVDLTSGIMKVDWELDWSQE